MQKTKSATCRRGHLFTPGNIYVYDDGHPRCRRCRYLATLRYREKKKQVQLPLQVPTAEELEEIAAL